MTGAEFNLKKKVQIELISLRNFSIKLSVTTILANDIVAGDNTYVSIFETAHSTYALCESDHSLTLKDVMNTVRLVGLTTQGYYAPFGDKNYFVNYGKKAYDAVFPARRTATSDTAFYQKMSPYNPALIRIARLDSEIRYYNPVSKKWLKEFDLVFQDDLKRQLIKVQ